MKHFLIFLVLVLSCGVVTAQFQDSTSVVATEDYSDNYAVTPSNPDPGTLPSTSSYKSEQIRAKKFDRKRWRDITGSANYDQRKTKGTKRSSANEDHSDNSGSGGSGSPGDYRQGDDGSQGDRRNAPVDDRYDQDDYDDDEQDTSESSQVEVSTPWGGGGLQIIFYVLIFIVIGIILFFVLKNISFKSNPKPANNSSADDATLVEDIATLDVETPLEKAQRSGNYKLAVRLYFLGLLKKLNETELIIWKKDKTNRDYLAELYAKARYYDEVRKLTLAYEQVWYGDHAIPVESFQQLKSEFLAVDQQLNANYTREKK